MNLCNFIQIKLMDWYYGNGTNVLVVPKEQEFSDRLPSPNSWHHWGTYSCPTFGSPNKFLVTGDEEIKLNMMSCSEAEMQLSPRNRHHSSASSTCEGLSSGPFHRNILSVNMPNCQIDLAKADQTDDIFLYKHYFGIKILDLMHVGNHVALEILPGLVNCC